MVQFATPQPISAVVDLPVADLLVVASDRDDTVVTVTPSRDTAGARRLAEAVRVDLSAGRLDVRTSLPRLSMVWLTGRDSIDVVVELPTGSAVEASTGAGRLETRGALGRTTVRSGAGNVVVERAGDLVVRASAGHVDVREAAGAVRVDAAAGAVRLGDVAGSVAVKASAGEVRLASAGGPVAVKAAAGAVAIGRAEDDLQIASSYGDVTVEEIVRGAAEVKTSHGEVRVGVRPGTAAWVDATTSYGRVETDLAAGGAPADAAAPAERLELRIRTGFGDVRVSRATAERDGAGAAAR